MQWLFLAGAVLSEVAATLCLRVAAAGRRGFYAAVAVGYVLAFVFLTLALRVGIGLGVAYGIWAAAGVALTAIASHVLGPWPLIVDTVSVRLCRFRKRSGACGFVGVRADVADRGVAPASVVAVRPPEHGPVGGGLVRER